MLRFESNLFGFHPQSVRTDGSKIWKERIRFGGGLYERENVDNT